MQILVFPVQDELYAVPLAAVREVTPRPRTATLPGAPRAVIGLMNVRGEIVPLFDVVRLTGTGETGAYEFAAIVELPAGTAGLAATGVPVSDALGERVGDADVVAGRGVHRQGDRLVTLLDLETLLSAAH